MASSRIRRASRRRAFARADTGIAAHNGCAARARSKADSTSARVDGRTSARRAPVAGFVISNGAAALDVGARARSEAEGEVDDKPVVKIEGGGGKEAGGTLHLYVKLDVRGMFPVFAASLRCLGDVLAMSWRCLGDVGCLGGRLGARGASHPIARPTRLR